MSLVDGQTAIRHKVGVAPRSGLHISSPDTSISYHPAPVQTSTSTPTARSSELHSSETFLDSLTLTSQPSMAWNQLPRNGLIDEHFPPTHNSLLEQYMDAGGDDFFNSDRNVSPPRDYKLALDPSYPLHQDPNLAVGHATPEPGQQAAVSTYAYPPSAYLLQPHDHAGYSSSTTDADIEKLLYSNTNELCLPSIPRQDSACLSQDLDSNARVRADSAQSDSELPTAGQDKIPKMPRIDDANLEKEEPYAKLIYRALMGAPGNTMILRDIYEWFRQNTDKASNKETKGWQNSIRHNLSMNGAFQKVDQPPGEEAKKGFMWRLTEQALLEGVKSTTRYRSKVPSKRLARNHNPLSQRQLSRAVDGKAVRKAPRPRRSQRLRQSQTSCPLDRLPCVSDLAQAMEHTSALQGGYLGPELEGIGDGDAHSPLFYQPTLPYSALDIASLSAPPSSGSVTTPTTPSTFHIDGPSMPGTPNSMPDYGHLLSLGPDEPIFYDVTESESPLPGQCLTESQMLPSEFMATELLL